MKSSRDLITAPLLLEKEHGSGTSSPAPPSEESPSGSENSLIEQVALTVPVTDDVSLPAVTFRTWVLGTLACVLLSFLNQFFWYRREPLSITSISAQIAVVPLGHFMASVFPGRVFFKGRRLEFTLNPGPFNVKEHVLITIFANSGAGNVYAIHIVSAVRLFYNKGLTFSVALLIVITTQVLGFGWAGLFRRYLVEPAAMWWPQNLVQVSLFRALHEKEKRRRDGLDWSSVSSYLGSPLASPWFATVNIAIGFALVMYVITPIGYWFNLFQARRFPIFSDGLFTNSGQTYNISAIVDPSFQLDVGAYERQGPLYLSTFFALSSYGIAFACLPATVVHVFLFHGREIWELSRSAFQYKKVDVHTMHMRKYKQVPNCWFMCMLFANIVTAIFMCEYYKAQLQLPWWGVLLACGIAFFFTLPVGVITATTNQTPGLNVITEYVIGYLYPGFPVANILFKVYGYISMKQGVTFVQDFKLGHYMKIPPRSMFMAQVTGTAVAAFVHLATAWWLMETVPNLCDREVVPAGSPWTCPGDHVFYDASVIWGLIGPRRIFGEQGNYGAVNWFFLAGGMAPVLVWLAHRALPTQKWIRLITMPVLLGVLLYICLEMEVVSLDWWGGDSDGCPLASCPTAPGVFIRGCPVF